MAGVDKTLTDEEKSMLQSSYTWYDYFSIPQMLSQGDSVNQTAAGPPPGFLEAVQSIPHYAARARFFIILAPPCVHANTGSVCNRYSWDERGWCRLERLARSTSPNETDLLLVEGPHTAQYVWPGQFMHKHPALGAFTSADDAQIIAPVVAAMVDGKISWLTEKGDHGRANFWRAFRSSCLSGSPLSVQMPPQDLEQWLTDRQLPSITAPGPRGWTAMHLAACEGHCELVRELASQKANVNAQANEGILELHGKLDSAQHTPLTLACVLGEEKLMCAMVPLLLELRADIHDKSVGTPPLYLACMKSDMPDLVSVLLSAGADVECLSITVFNDTPLFASARMAGPKTMRVLLEAGASPHTVSMFSSTPLHALSSNSMGLEKMRECVTLLVQARGNVNARLPAPNMKAKILQTIAAGLHGLGAKQKKFENLALCSTQPTPLSLATFWNNGSLIVRLLDAHADLSQPVVWCKSADEYAGQNPESALALALEYQRWRQFRISRQSHEQPHGLVEPLDNWLRSLGSAQGRFLSAFRFLAAPDLAVSSDGCAIWA
eukprot:gnl/TRDRNA2_/TRDRNA2_177488_c3_seq4.p1 gnl/TRDRNA2_/TRDRNA2_177488_c3~~gnl/TRDRNA2_/TRDRNA2_177488_c3_seq4.p1  ORF type:complete len:576 (-),score=66.51 gnl/TRDRNA2_/TRDRNA2_177488_c3_seq4:215-1861(-)